MKKILYLLPLMMLPMFAAAAPAGIGSAGGLQGIMDVIISLLDTVVVILVSLAVVFFIWGVVKYVAADSDEDRTKGRKIMINGIIAIFVIVSVWGLVNVLENTFNLGGGTANTPELPSK